MTRLQRFALSMIMDLAEQNMLSKEDAENCGQLEIYEEQQWAMQQVRKLRGLGDEQ